MIKPLRTQDVIFAYHLEERLPFLAKKLTYYPKHEMRTRTTGLTAQELARYLGGRVQVLIDGVNAKTQDATLVAVDITKEMVKISYEGSHTEYELNPDSVRPVLRKLITISDEDAKDCFRVAYELEQDFDIQVTRGNDYIELFYEPVTLIVTTQGVIVSSKDSGYRVGPAQVNARTLLNYLNVKGFDLEGLIDAGLSADEETLVG